MKLIPLTKSDWPEFMKECQASFALAVEHEGNIPDELIPPNADLLENLQASNAQSFYVQADGKIVGDVILQISESRHNHLDFST